MCRLDGEGIWEAKWSVSAIMYKQQYAKIAKTWSNEASQRNTRINKTGLLSGSVEQFASSSPCETTTFYHWTLSKNKPKTHLDVAFLWFWCNSTSVEPYILNSMNHQQTCYINHQQTGWHLIALSTQ